MSAIEVGVFNPARPVLGAKAAGATRCRMSGPGIAPLAALWLRWVQSIGLGGVLPVRLWFGPDRNKTFGLRLDPPKGPRSARRIKTRMHRSINPDRHAVVTWSLYPQALAHAAPAITSRCSPNDAFIQSMTARTQADRRKSR